MSNQIENGPDDEFNVPLGSDSITSRTCVHHTDVERREISCPCCLKDKVEALEKENARLKQEVKEMAFGDVECTSGVPTRDQAIIAILTEAMANIASDDFSNYQDTAKTALARADAVGKGEK